MKVLPSPLGFSSSTSESEVKKRMLKMGIRVESGYIYFNEVLYRLMRNLYGNFKLNDKMIKYEMITQYKIMEKTIFESFGGSKLKD